MVLSILRFSLLIVMQLSIFSSDTSNNFSKGHSKERSVKFEITDENPVISPQNIIFEVKHSKTANVVVYQANKTVKNLLNPDKPIDVFWLMNTKGKKVESLTSLEWRLAYGYKIKTIISGKKYSITLNAIEEKVITINQDEKGKVEAFMTINGVYSKLAGVYIDYEYTFCLPSVKYVQFTGNALNSNKVVVERVEG